METECKYFVKYVSQEYNIGFKVPRSDQCNDCALFLKMIAEATNDDEKDKIEKLFDSHRRDAEMCQDFMYWMFQKAYAQMGKDYQEWESLEVWEDDLL